MDALENYKLDGLEIVKSELENPRMRCVDYGLFVIATDSLGTQICKEGRFYGGSFKDIESAISWLKTDDNLKKCTEFFLSEYEEPSVAESLFDLMFMMFNSPQINEA